MFGLCSASRFGDFRRCNEFSRKMVFYIMTQVINYYVKVAALRKSPKCQIMPDNQAQHRPNGEFTVDDYYEI